MVLHSPVTGILSYSVTWPSMYITYTVYRLIIEYMHYRSVNYISLCLLLIWTEPCMSANRRKKKEVGYYHNMYTSLKRLSDFLSETYTHSTTWMFIFMTRQFYYGQMHWKNIILNQSYVFSCSFFWGNEYLLII